MKCETIGEYSYVTNTNVFPKVESPKKTDEGFRAKKCESPLLQLKRDMVEHIPIAKLPNLLHLGVMKRMLFGWRDGTFRNSETKWSFRTISMLSDFLKQCKMPREIHRAVRGLECLPHWKGTEYRRPYFL